MPDLHDNVARFLSHDGIFKLYSRNSSVQIAENFAYFCMLELKKIRGLEFQQLMLGRNEFMDVYCRNDEFSTVENTITAHLDRSKNIKDFFEHDALPVFARYTAFTKRMHKKYTGPARANFQDLLPDYQAFAKINAEFIAFNFFIYLSDPVIDRILRTALTHYLESINKIEALQKYLVRISTPLKKPAIVLEHLALLKLIAADEAKNENKLRDHAEKWSWFPCYNPSDDRYTLQHYEDEIKSYTTESAAQELQKISEERTHHAADYARLLKEIKDPELQKLIPIINSVSYYRERRNDLRRQGYAWVRGLYEAIGTQLGLTVKEVCYLTNEEIQESLRRGSGIVPPQRIRGRFSDYLIFTDLRINQFSDAKGTIQKIRLEIRNKEEKNSTVRGITAVAGLVQGTVRVITSIKVLDQFKKGEVLVASMTAPEYVPAMKKAAAIITDEGGITCHAAVISRELGTPCIVGTKVATKFLRDGDVVEVDAQNGTVKKL